MLKLGIHMDNELLYYGIESRTLCSYSSLYLSIFYPVFFVFVFRLLRNRVTIYYNGRVYSEVEVMESDHAAYEI